MLARLIAICFSIFFLSQCRSTNSQLRQDTEQTNYKLFNNDFDWLGKSSPLTATRTLTYCVQRGTDKIFANAFARATKRIDQLFQNQPQKWQIIAANPIECPDTWSLREKRLGAIPQLRIRQEPMEVTTKPTTNYQPFSFDSFSINDALVQNPNAMNPEDKTYGMHPINNEMTNSHLADFSYEKHFRHFYIISAEIVFNTHNAIVWDSEFSDKQSADPDLVALHMLGHALKLKHDDNIYDDIQLIPCGSAGVAGNAQPTVAIKGAKDRDLVSSALGDDQRIEGDKVITAGQNNIVESSKSIPIMFPFLRLGTHCVNPTSPKPEERYNFMELEKETLTRTAIIDGV